MRYRLIIGLFLLVSCGSKNQESKPNSTFKIEVERSDEDTSSNKLHRLEVQAGFKNITLGKSLEEFNLGSDWAVKTKTDLFGRTFGDSIISAYDSSYHEQIGEGKVDNIELIFINKILMIIEVRMVKGIYPKSMLIRPNLLPFLIEKFGEPNKIPYEEATFDEQKGAILSPKLRLVKDIKPTVGILDEFLAQSENKKANPVVSLPKGVTFRIAAWQTRNVNMEFIEDELTFEESPNKTRTETLRYSLPGADSIDSYIYKKAEQLENQNEITKRKEAHKL